MSNIRKYTVLNSESKVKKGRRFLLEYSDKNLVPCTIEEHEDDFDFLFNLDKLDEFTVAMDRPLEEKYRLLYNCGELEDISIEYNFSIAPRNIVLDNGLRPKVLIRDIGEQDDFLSKYKALAASVLYPKYTYEDYLFGGVDLYSKSKNIEWLNSKNDVSEIKEYLYELFRNQQEKALRSKTVVGKNTLRVLRVWSVLVTVLVIGCAALMYYIFAMQLPDKNSYINASNAYLAENYEGVINAYSNRDIDDISLEGKYMLARSFVTSESLTADQKEWVLQGLTLRTEVPILDFWIETGRLSFVDAIDIAQRINDDELLLFAYIKQSVALENDTNLSGEEKSAQLAKIEAKIETLSQEMKEDELVSAASSTD